MADEFLLVVGDEWTELADAPAKFLVIGDTFESVINTVYNQSWPVFSSFLQDLGLIEPLEEILAAQAIRAAGLDNVYRFWYLRP